MRISTTQFYQMNVAQMSDQQAQLSQLYQQISSGVSLSTPADNPLGAAQAVQLSMTSATLSQYSSNQNVALSSLQKEDQTLFSVNDLLNTIHSVVIHAGDGSLADSDRAALSTQLQGYRDQLLTLANSTDGAGNYLFAGFQSTTAPFSNAPGGGVNYSGDTGSRQVQIADTRAISQGDSGASVFLSVPMLGSQPVPLAGANNTGTGTIGAVSITSPSAATNTHQFTITFGGTAAAPTYTVTDNSVVPPTPGAAQPYTADSAIALGNGLSVPVSGTPALGDTFTITPAPKAGTDVFAALDSMITALKTPISNNTAAATALANTMTTGTTKLNNMMTNVLTVQASVGGREQEIKAMQAVNQTNTLQITSNLSDLTSTNMVSTISQFLQMQNALTGSQKAYAQLQNLSLFQYINP
ncbi:TPA: flagellar hook-associated protein FlgL [Burkholderia aenigmatica]|uniref:flagellar hook-associated protein FlgL n=1 Tax=Burkholderia sp. AU45251 TaxID=3059204 RepID=UPI002654D412|nr:flagellar hook-associated protein FlgL [Burkholderia sp. AU45251]HDR9488155.1 flagellar hook-associated protein FlgL [Burkholderia aenigmatica]MDN7518919.1 flagellar hook-associated protein FlgL [Burkholderia sp. AU45251]HDR9519960.1 flagellar hook-associated protein FlgL [Burkholderia aenigmatica]HDR9596990.1 flagellar hook-associated protein FlgL [Burkholderia aenigmatica]HDR9604975.1 flagellar hook-associated protein FlgL [Burkholderia aenigmatica]